MSKEIDEKIVQMKFDNSNFEKNVRTSMSTIDKLKERLSFKGATRGMDELEKRASKISLNGLSKATDVVRTKFSALQIAGITAITNITNSAVNAGKQMVKSLSIDPVMDGFNKYETKVNATKVIMNSTGESLSTVNKYLKELNQYSDETIYSFSDMTQNIGKFTNAGVKLKDAVDAIKGISNEAALSGASTEEASRAMYNFSQALSQGSVKLIDWKSIENANMATMEFKQQLIDTAVELGTVVKQGDKYVTTTKDLNGNVSNAFKSTTGFNESLSHQWMTTEVLTKTLQKYASTETEIGKRANKAATEFRTFSAMMDSMKDAAGTAWSKTFELIFGDVKQATELWTDVGNVIGGFLDKINNARNELLEGALGKPVDSLTAKIQKYSKGVKMATLSSKELDKMADRVFNGEFGNGEKRIESLTKSGYDYVTIQNKVNKSLGINYDAANDLANMEKKIAKMRGMNIKKLTEMSDKQLKSINFTDDEISSFRKLQKQSEKSGKSIEELMKAIQPAKTGRDLLIESFHNALEGLNNIMSVVKKAWRDIFPKTTSKQLYDIIKNFNEFTNKLKLNDDASKNLRKTLRGLFAALDIIKTIAGGALKLAFEIIGQLMGKTGKDIMDTTGSIGDLIVKLRDWIKNNDVVGRTVAALAKIIVGTVNAIAKFIKVVKDSVVVQTIWSGIKAVGGSVFGFLSNVFGTFIDEVGEGELTLETLGDKFVEIGKYMIEGLKNGILNNPISRFFINLASGIVNTFKDILGIHSPSTVMFDIGKFIIEGLINGIKSIANKVTNLVGSVVGGIVNTVNQIDFAPIISVIAGGSVLLILKKFASALEGFSKPLSGVGDLLEGTGKMLNNVGKGVKKFLKGTAKLLKALAFSIKAKALKNIALSIGVLAVSLYLLSKIKPSDIKPALSAMAGIATILVTVSIAMEKFGSANVKFGKTGLSFDGLRANFLKLAIAVLALTLCIKLIGKMDEKEAKKGFSGLLTMFGMVGAILAEYAILSINAGGTGKKDSLGKVMKQIGIAMLLMLSVVKTCGKMDENVLSQGIGALLIFSGIIGVLIAFTKFSGKHLAGTVEVIKAVGKTMVLMTVVCRIIGKMEYNDFGKAVVGITLFGIIIAGLIAATRLAEKGDIPNVGPTLMMVAGAMAIMAISCRIIGAGKWSSFAKGMIGVTLMSLIIKNLIKSVVGVRGKVKQVGPTLLMISAAMAIMASLTIVLGLMSLKSLAKGVTAIGIIGIIISMLIRSSASTSKVKMGPLIAICSMLAVLVAGIAILSELNTEKMIVAVGSLSTLMSMLSITLLSVSKTKKVNTKPVIAMIGILVVITAAVYALTRLPIANALISVFMISKLLSSITKAMSNLSGIKSLKKGVLKDLAALTGIMAMLGLIIIMLKQYNYGEGSVITGVIGIIALSNGLVKMENGLSLIKGKINKGILSQIWVLTGVMTVLSVIAMLLNHFNFGFGNMSAGVLAVLALSAGLVKMETALSLIKGKINKGILSQIWVLTGVIAVLGTMVVALSKMSGSAIKAAIGVACIIKLLDHLTACFYILSKTGKLKKGVMSGLYAITGIVGILAVIFAKISKIKNPIRTALVMTVIRTTLLSIAGIFSVLMLIDADAAKAAKAAEAMGIAIGALTTALAALGGLDELTSGGLSKVLNDGGKILGILGSAIGQFIGGIIGGISVGIAKSFVAVGNALGEFTKAATPFFNFVKNDLDGDMVKRVGILSAALLILATTEFIAGFNNIIGTFVKSSSLVIMGQSLSEFANSSAGFFSMLEDMNKNTLNGAKTLVETILDITKAQLIQGIAKFFKGAPDLEEFGSQLEDLGKGLKKFNDAIGEYGAKDYAKTAMATDSITKLAKASQAIPKIGGLLGALVGKTDFGPFVTNMPKLGEGIATFAKNLADNGFNSKRAKMANTASSSIKALANASKSIPSSGGWLQLIFGEKDLQTFAAAMGPLGQGIADFAKNLGDINNCKSVKTGAEAVKILAEAASKIPNSGGALADLVGDNDMKTFAEEFPYVADGIKQFSDKLSGMTDSDMSAVKKGAEVVKVLADAAEAIGPNDIWDWLVGGDKESITTFCSRFPDLGTCVKQFSDNLGSFTNEQYNKIDAALRVVTTFANSDISVQSLAEDADMWQTAMTRISETLGTFYQSTKDIDSNQFCNMATGTQRLLDALGDQTGKIKSTDFADYADAVSYLSEADFSSFKLGDDVKEADINTFINVLDQTIDLFNRLSSMKQDGSDNLKKNLQALAKVNIADTIEGFIQDNSEVTGQNGPINTIGAEVCRILAGALNANAGKVASASSDIADDIVNTLNPDGDQHRTGYGSTLYAYGVNAVTHFINGAKSMCNVSEDGEYTGDIATLLDNIMGVIINRFEDFATAGNTVGDRFKAGLSQSLSSLDENNINDYLQTVGNIDLDNIIFSDKEQSMSTSTLDFLSRLTNVIAKMSKLPKNAADNYASAISKLNKTNVGALIDKFSGYELKLNGIGRDMVDDIYDGMLQVQWKFATVVGSALQDIGDEIDKNAGGFRVAGIKIRRYLNSGIEGKFTGAHHYIEKFLNSLGSEGSMKSFRTIGDDLAGEFVSAFMAGLNKLDAKSIKDKIEAINSVNINPLEMDEWEVEDIQNGVEALQNVIAMINTLKLKNAKDFKASIDTLAATDLHKFAKAYSNAASDINVSGQVAKTFIKSIASGIATHLAQSEEFTESAHAFTKRISTVLNNKKDSIPEIKAIGKNIADNIVKGFKNYPTSDSEKFTDNVTSLTKAINNKVSSKARKNEFSSSGAVLAEALCNGLKDKDKVHNIVVSFDETLDSCIAHIRKRHGSINKKTGEGTGFMGVGMYLAQGLAKGMSDDDSTRSVIKAATQLGKDAKTATAEETEVNSPSKAFYRIGAFCGEGLVNGLNAYRIQSYNAGSSVGEYAKKGLSRTIDTINNALGDGIDTSPTIRPVVDLSDVRRSTRAINGILSNGTTIRSSRSIPQLMKEIQNGNNNSDIIKAINELGGAISEINSTTTNINGITYSEGTEINDAVKTIVRAAKMGRRR